MSFSPAPWIACHQGDCTCGLVWSIPADQPIARCLDRNDEEGTQYPRADVRANARLISKAPKMYEVLATLEEDKDLAYALSSWRAIRADVDGEKP